VVVGAVLGAICGFFGSAPAMMMPAGGRAHGDMVWPLLAALVGAVLGALLGPKVISAGLRVVERRRIDRLNGEASPTLVPALLYLGGVFVAACASFTSLYAAVSEPVPPDPRGPISNGDPVLAPGVALVLTVVFGVVSGVCLFRALRSAR